MLSTGSTVFMASDGQGPKAAGSDAFYARYGNVTYAKT